jgi:hypothetical protein
MVALIGVISAGCGSHEPSETAAASTTGTTSNKRATDQHKNASPSSVESSRSAGSQPSTAGSPHSPAGRLPYAGSNDAAVPGALSPEPMSTQSPHDGRRHE